jgi:TM2 domain-containing membrane protein YozV
MTQANARAAGNSHSLVFGYLLWIFGFTGSHRFYYGKTATGLLWLATGGLFLVGWIVDFFLIPSMDRNADLRFPEGPVNYSIAWLLLTYAGYLGIHRFYMGKWATGLLYLLTFGLLGFGWMWDFCTMNTLIAEVNAAPARA